MRNRRTRAAATLVAAGLIIGGALAGAAGASGSASGLQIAEAGISHFPDMAFTLGLPKPQPLTAAQVHVTENGGRVQNVTVAKPGAEDVGVVLVIDASNSMKGEPIAQAMAAARAFAARRNPGQQLALIVFNDKSTIVLPLTNDQAAITKALAQNPELAAGTHIYDAIQEAGQLLANARVSTSSIVLLSDGNDVGSTVDQATAISSLADTKTRVFAVGLTSGQSDPATLQAISETTGGSYTEASGSAALTQIYSQLGYTLSNEYLLRYRSLAGPDVKTNVVVQVQGIPGTARAVYTTPALPTVAAPGGQSTWDKIVRSTVTLILVILAAVSLLGYAVFKFLYRPDQDLKRRIGQFVTLPEEERRAKERQVDVAELLAVDEKTRELRLAEAIRVRPGGREDRHARQDNRNPHCSRRLRSRDRRLDHPRIADRAPGDRRCPVHHQGHRRSAAALDAEGVRRPAARQPRRAGFRLEIGTQLPRRARGLRRRRRRALEGRVPPCDRRRSARRADRRGTPRDGISNAESRCRSDGARRQAAARCRHQRGRRARPGGRQRSCAARATAPRDDADSAGADGTLDRLAPSRSSSSSGSTSSIGTTLKFSGRSRSVSSP